MKKSIALLCVLCALLLTACQPNNSQNPTEAPNTTTTQASTQAPTTQSTAPLEDPACKEMDALFGNTRSWYNYALVSLYDHPSKISLQTLFYNGFPGESQDPTDAEWEALKDLPGFKVEYDLMRLPKDKMNEVLTTLFGITLEDVADTGFEGLVYLESTECYYHMVTGAMGLENFETYQVDFLEDGTVKVFYTTYGEYRVATLMPNGEDYQILSNIMD